MKNEIVMINLFDVLEVLAQVLNRIIDDDRSQTLKPKIDYIDPELYNAIWTLIAKGYGDGTHVDDIHGAINFLHNLKFMILEMRRARNV